jgi:PKD repeat protein
MKKAILFLSISLLVVSQTTAQNAGFQSFRTLNSNKNITVVDSISVSTFLNYMLFSGNIDVSNISYTGNMLSIGYFSDDELSSGLDCGVVISTGKVDDISNPASFFASTNHSLPGDSALSAYIGGNTRDAIIIEFDMSMQDSIFLCSEYVFASEEYPEYVNSNYNDMFGFFISGPNPNGGVYDNLNIALIPGTNQAVSINNVNNGHYNNGPCMNCNYYINNAANQHFVMDGMTQVLPASIQIIPDSIYRVRLAVSDVQDGIYDSSVLLRVFSFSQPLDTLFFTFDYQVISNHPFQVQFIPNMNGNVSADKYFWDFGDGTFSFEESPIHTYENSNQIKTSLFANNKTHKGSFSRRISPTTSIVNNNLMSTQRIVTPEKYKVEFANTINKGRLNIYSMDGRHVKFINIESTNSLEVNISNLAKGAYIVKIESENGNWQDKFVK